MFFEYSSHFLSWHCFRFQEYYILQVFGCFTASCSADGLVNCRRKEPSNPGSRKFILMPASWFKKILKSGEKYSIGVRNSTSTLLEHCLAKICQTCILLGTFQVNKFEYTRKVVVAVQILIL